MVSPFLYVAQICESPRFFAAFFCTLAVANSIEGMYWFLVIGSAFLTAGIFGFGGQMLRARGALNVDVGEKAD